MIKVFICLSMIFCLVSASSDTTDSTNEIEHKPPINLDPALRRALLKAIEDLENEPEAEETTVESTTTEDNEILAHGDDATDEINTETSVTDQVPSVQYHSFVVDGQKAFQNDTVSITAKIKKLEEVKKPQRENVDIKAIDPVAEKDIEPRASSNAFSQTRSIQQDFVVNNYIKSNVKQVVSKVESTTKSAPTTTTTTVAPTPKPKFNEDGENIEELENHEVQVFQAPLVAAFTVHQDAHGLPRSVVPIYKQAIRKPITPVQPVTSMNLNTPKPTQTQQRLLEQTLIQQQLPLIPQNQIQQQLYIQQQLEQKQRILEDQLQKLQSQQRQHEELLRQQHFIQQQQLLYAQNEQRRQQERLLEEQNKLRQQQYLEQQKSLQNQNLIQSNQIRQHHKNNQSPTSVSFQPSISLSSLNSVTEQQPPQREAVDFLVHLRSGQQSPFPLQQSIPLTPSVLLQLPHEKPFANNFAKSNQNSGNVRVFRQDSGTGNFGLNNNVNSNFFNRNNNFQQQNFNKNAPRLSQNNQNNQNNLNRYTHDDELNKLLYQSGLTQGGRSQEDLSIISKVLALNHGITNTNFLNRDFFTGESRRLESKVRPGQNGNS